VPCGEEAGETKSVLERFREIVSQLLLYNEMTIPADKEIVTVQHSDGNAERNVNSKEQDPELFLGEGLHG